MQAPRAENAPMRAERDIPYGGCTTLVLGKVIKSPGGLSGKLRQYESRKGWRASICPGKRAVVMSDSGAGPALHCR